MNIIALKATSHNIFLLFVFPLPHYPMYSEMGGGIADGKKAVEEKK